MVAAAPYNEFGHADRLAGPADEFVSLNNDTLYSIAQIDLAGGPVRLDVPETAGRYYVLQFVDAWTNNFAYVGRRATGTAPQSYLLVPPGWDGEAPADAEIIRFPTRIGAIVGRIAVEGPDDVPAVREIQRDLKLQASGQPEGVPAPTPGVSEELLAFEEARVAIAAFPPAARDVAFQEALRPLGLLDEPSPYVDPDPEFAAALVEGLAAGRAQLERLIVDATPQKQNGWGAIYHVFDYNLDFFEIGTLNRDEWKMAEGPERIAARAVAARAGLWGNHGYEAAYAAVYIDADEQPLDGANSYTLTFASDPPVGAFWSVTMYDDQQFYLVENPIDRYSFGDRTSGLVRAEDGSITVHLQHEEPSDAAARANWLPTPAARFRPLMRLYEPGDEAFDGRFILPPIVRID